MIIKKLEKELTFKEINTTHKIEVNGKKVGVYEYTKYDPQFDVHEYECGIRDGQGKDLTDDEKQLIEENMEDILGLEDGKELELEDLA